ncbi:MAG: hypothetical protein M3Z20_17325 [Chloroflexota bacterium]|nr:hypothetical protein [Chloroflexota bacterium]
MNEPHGGVIPASHHGLLAAVGPEQDGAQLRAIIRTFTGVDELPGLEEERAILVIEPVRTNSMG